MMGGSSGLAGRMLRRCKRAGGETGESVLARRGALVGGGGGGRILESESAVDGVEECRDEKSESLGRLIRDGILFLGVLSCDGVCFTVVLLR